MQQSNSHIPQCSRVTHISHNAILSNYFQESQRWLKVKTPKPIFDWPDTSIYKPNIKNSSSFPLFWDGSAFLCTMSHHFPSASLSLSPAHPNRRHFIIIIPPHCFSLCNKTFLLLHSLSMLAHYKVPNLSQGRNTCRYNLALNLAFDLTLIIRGKSRRRNLPAINCSLQ